MRIILGSFRALRERGSWRGGGQGAKSQCLPHFKVFVFRGESKHFKVFAIHTRHDES